MRNNKIKFNVAPEILDLNINVASVLFEGISNKQVDVAFDMYKQEVFEKFKSRYSNEFISKNNILDGFRKLHSSIGRSNRKFVSSTEYLLKTYIRRGYIPVKNLAVDIYNVISLETLLSIGAHDVDKVEGDINFKMTDGSEKFLPLGSKKIKQVPRGEYCYIDNNSEIICRMECKQAEKTKIEEISRNCVFIVQGNEYTSREFVIATLEKLIIMIKLYCQGDETILYKPIN
jgi:DNA/RNA-binding domain of Phe-tRNA-synthetase-like protein